MSFSAIFLFAGAALARDDLPELQADWQRNLQFLSKANAQTEQLNAQLAGESRIINELKAREGDSILPNFTLNRHLRRSQELSTMLDKLDEEATGLKHEALRAARRCLDAVDARLESCGGAECAGLRKGRTVILEWLGDAEVPRSPLPALRISVNALDGPEELQEKADLLKDREETLREQARRVAKRIDEVKRRRHLLRQRSDFIREEMMFDEPAYFPNVAAEHRDNAAAVPRPTPTETGVTETGGAPASAADGSPAASRESSADLLPPSLPSFRIGSESGAAKLAPAESASVPAPLGLTAPSAEAGGAAAPETAPGGRLIPQMDVPSAAELDVSSEVLNSDNLGRLEKEQQRLSRTADSLAAQHLRLTSRAKLLRQQESKR